MARTGFFKGHKDLMAEFVGNNNKILNKPLGKLIRRDIGSERVDFLRQYIDLLLNSRMLTKETKIYLLDRYITYDGVAEKLGEETGTQINSSTTKAKIWQDKNKIIRAFGERMLVDILEYDNIDFEDYKERLLDAQHKYGNSKLLRNVCLALPETPYQTTSISEKDFNDFIDIISPYTRRQMDIVVNDLLDPNLQALSYIRYILSSGLLKSIDEKRKERIIELLSED